MRVPSAIPSLLRSGPGGVAVLLALEVAVFSLWTHLRSPTGEVTYLTGRAITSLLEATTVYAFLALAQTPVMIAGGIDLSIGSTLALGQCICAALITTDPTWRARGFPGLPGWAGVAGGVTAGAVMGLTNGILVSAFRVPPFLLTLGTLSAGRGLSILLSRSSAISELPGHAIPGTLRAAPEGVGLFERFGKPDLSAIHVNSIDIYFPTLVFAALAILVAFLLHRTRLGRAAYAIGGNEEAARLAGLHVPLTKVLLYSLCGAIAGTAGVMSAYQYGTFDPQAGMGYELGAVAACVGGVSLTGGLGGVMGPALGALLFAGLRKGLNQTGVGGEWNELALGGVIVLAVLVDSLRRQGLRQRERA